MAKKYNGEVRGPSRTQPGRSIVTPTDAKRLKALLAAYPDVLGPNEHISRRLSESWARFCEWEDAWRRAHERNPEYRPKEDDTIDDYLLGAMEFLFGAMQWSPDDFDRATPQDYERALIGHYKYAARAGDNGRAPSRKRSAEQKVDAAMRAFANIPGWATRPREQLRNAVAKELGYTVGRSTLYLALRKALADQA
jgi:hypothetical protein